MNIFKEPYLEPYPGMNQVEEEKKEAEAKINSNQQIQTETSKKEQVTGKIGKSDSSKSRKSPNTRLKELIFKEKHRKNNRLFGRNSLITFDVLFLDDPSSILKEKGVKEEEDTRTIKNIGESKPSTEQISKEFSLEINNTKRLFGYSSKVEKNIIINGLRDKIDELKRKQRMIDIQFKNDSEVYQRKISYLEKACQENYSIEKYKELEKINRENKECIKKYKKLIEQKEKEKIEDKKNFYNNLNEIIDLKATLMEELKELEILAKNASFQDYDEYLKDNPSKIDKLNFRANDSRYLLTNEYETSREEESYSSYEKLNHINNTPEGFDINKQNNTFDKTEQYFNNTKNFVGTVGSNRNTSNNNSFYNNRVNHSFIIKRNNHNMSNKELANYSFKKNETLSEMRSRKSFNEISKKDTKKKGLSNFNVNNKNKGEGNIKQRISPLDFNKNRMPQDPDVFNNDMILIRQDENFY